MSTAPGATPLTPARRRAAIAGISAIVFMAALEATVVGTAMPTIVTQLGGLPLYGWVFSAYLLAATATIPIWGRAADLYGLRIVYTAATATFLLGSLACGTATSIATLIAARSVQGWGAGGVVPVGLAVSGALFSPRERARLQGLFSSVWGAAALVGPLLGGWLTASLSWRWVFWIGVPFGSIGAALVFGSLGHLVPGNVGRAGRRLNLASAFLLVVASGALLWALDQAPRLGSGAARTSIAVALGLAVVAGLGFRRMEARTPDPILPMALVRRSLIGVGCGVVALVGLCLFGLMAFIPMWLQLGRGTGAIRAGSALSALLLGWVLAAAFGTRLILRTGYRAVVRGGCAGLASTALLLAVWGPHTSLAVLQAGLSLFGMSVGLVVPALLVAMQNEVEVGQIGATTSLNHFSRQMGGALGVSVTGSLVASSASLSIAMTWALGLNALVACSALLLTFALPLRPPLNARLPAQSPGKRSEPEL